jgi:2-polyprenyl-6-methoxyphenol hydroxylase-like FAD-dependent oxidoreductase
MSTEVLIVGAGPSGLALALWLTRLGIRVRIIDRSPSSGLASRAFALQARTLEFYDQIGIARDAIGRGRPIAAINVRFTGERSQPIAIGDFGRGFSPFPFVLILLQDSHEKLLIDHLGAAGVRVEWNTELIDLTLGADGVRAQLKGPGAADQVCEAAYLCGCDGAGSSVRALCDIGFPGDSSGEIFYVADVEAQGPVVDGGLHYVMSSEHLCSIFPLKGEHRVRLIGLVPKAVRQAQFRIGFDDVRQAIERETGLQVQVLEAFATYRVHQRIASEWRKGRAFLLGDAAHVHSPAGGLGLNAGVGDAVNLAWKLAAVLRGAAAESLLDTYQGERMAAARQIAATTDWGFALQARHGPAMSFARWALTRLTPTLFRLGAFRHLAFRTLSQLAIDYRGVGSCAGEAGGVAGGDRLPWIRLNGQADNFAGLKGLGWQAHVYGEAEPRLRQACAAWGLALQAFPWIAAMGRAGLMRNAVYLIRPDGYVAYAGPTQAPEALGEQLARFAIVAAPRPGG